MKKCAGRGDGTFAVPKTSDIIIEFHRKIEENYFKRRTYRRCVASRRMKEWWLVHSDREYDTLYS